MWYIHFLAALKEGWLSFWHVLWSGEWVANVGLPMLVSVTALVVAYHFFRTQLAHDRRLAADQAERDRVSGAEQAHRDRELVREQLQSARDDVERERRRDAMRRFADHLYDYKNVGDSPKPSRPIDLSVLTDLIDRTELVTGTQPILDQTLRVAQYCNMRASAIEHWLQRHIDGVSKFRLFFARSSFFGEYMDDLRLIGQACYAWDGDSDLGELASVRAPTAEQVAVLGPAYDDLERELAQEWRDLVE